VKCKTLLLLLVVILLAACGPAGPDTVPVAELPDPIIYAIRPSELPEVGLDWQQSYNQTTLGTGFKWSYLAYQAYQPGNMGVDLESAFAVNNDVVLYEKDMSQADLPLPPQSMGNIQNITWKNASLSQRLGDKSAVWKTTVGDLFTPIWWLEFYQGHAYARISLLGFPDQIAPSILYGLGDILAKRLPHSTNTLRADAATVFPTLSVPTITPQSAPTEAPLQATPSTETGTIPVVSYTTPPGEVGMVSYFDETGYQLTDGVFGSNDILADNGHGTAYEWVGWTDQTDPITLTFTLEGNTAVGAVQIGFNHRDGLGIFVPAEVTINGTRFELEAEAVPNNERATLTFNGPFRGPIIEIVLQHRGRGWILIDEVSFLPTQ
jgi:predicted small lipoprotein YifL